MQTATAAMIVIPRRRQGGLSNQRLAGRDRPVTQPRPVDHGLRPRGAL